MISSQAIFWPNCVKGQTNNFGWNYEFIWVMTQNTIHFMPGSLLFFGVIEWNEFIKHNNNGNSYSNNNKSQVFVLCYNYFEIENVISIFLLHDCNFFYCVLTHSEKPSATILMQQHKLRHVYEAPESRSDSLTITHCSVATGLRLPSVGWDGACMCSAHHITNFVCHLHYTTNRNRQNISLESDRKKKWIVSQIFKQQKN